MADVSINSTTSTDMSYSAGTTELAACIAVKRHEAVKQKKRSRETKEQDWINNIRKEQAQMLTRQADKAKVIENAALLKELHALSSLNDSGASGPPTLSQRS
jgi:hypothetical protein